MAVTRNPQAAELANGLIRLSTEFKSSEPGQAAALKKEFKTASKNELARTVVYLMEVVGVSDLRIKDAQKEIADLKEILKLNNVDLEAGDEETAKVEAAGAEGTGTETTVGGNQGAQAAQTGAEGGTVSQGA